MSGSYDYDLLLLSDLRYPGGNSASIAEEVKVQARAGYSTALMHVPAPHMTRSRSFNRKIMHCLSSGIAELVSADRPLRVRAVIARQPRLFTHDLPVRLRVQADAAVLVVNHPPFDGLRNAGNPYYDATAVRKRVKHLFGETQWAPIGPLVREALTRSGATLALRAEDWVNIVDIDDWWVDRSAFRSDRPVIGRHSRSHLSKWPSSAAAIRAAYPTDDGVEVRILGGAEPAIKVLGECPPQWTVFPFGAMSAQRFLRLIDFFVYYHHPAWVEAFGRNIIEAMASGCPVILPAHFERVFGDSCLYAAPSGARSIVESLYADPARYRAWSARSTAYAATHFGPAMHLRRIAELVGEPGQAPHRVPVGRRRRTLLIGAEPTGLGSATRLLRVAEALPGDAEAVLLARWPAMELGREAGWLSELLADDELAAENAERLAQRVAMVVDQHDADAVIVDARRPAAGLLAAARDLDVPFVWLRPADGEGESADVFSATVTIDDWATAAGPGASLQTVRHGHTPLTRAAARVALDVAQDARLALLCCGADARGVSVSSLAVLADALVADGWTVVFAEPRTGGDEVRLPAAVRRVALHPLPVYLAGFDVAVAGPGRTLLPELVEAQLPTLLVALRSDAARRRLGAAAGARGVALWVDDLGQSALREGLAKLADEAARAELGSACAAMASAIEDARDAILSAVSGQPGAPADVSVGAR